MPSVTSPASPDSLTGISARRSNVRDRPAESPRARGASAGPELKKSPLLLLLLPLPQPDSRKPALICLRLPAKASSRVRQV